MVRPLVPLVARTGEFATLRHVLDAAAAGDAGAVLLGGDAGVGKTRLLTELIETASAEGVLVLVGHCIDLGDTPPPYLPFGEAFARLATDRPELAAALREHRPPLERLLPDRTARADDDRIDRVLLFETVLGSLAELADVAPVLLVIEDAHWADQATRDLLGYLFTRLRAERVAVVVSYRSDDLHRRHPLLGTLTQWARLATVTRLELQPLDGDEVRTLIRTLHPAPLADNAVRDIVDRADGNAFFVEELLAAGDHLPEAGHLPWLLADLLLARLNTLSDDGREVVRFAAVAGRGVPHGMLSDAIALPLPRLDAALREAVDAHILQLTRGGLGYTFRHALVAEAVYDDLLPGERVRLHAAFAAVLAEDDVRSRAELARHALASHDLSTAYRASLMAGREAMAVAAPQEALAHFETALELRPRLDPAPPDAVALVVDLVDAAVAAGQPSRGRRLASQGLAALPADATPVDRARVLYAVARAAIDSEAEVGSLDAAREALDLLPREPSVLRARVAGLYSRVCLARGRVDDAEHWARESIDAADSLDRPGAAAEARTTLAILARRVEEPADVARVLHDLVDRASRDGEAQAEIRSRYSLGSLYYEQGRLADAEAAYELAWTRATELGRTWTLFGLDARAMVVLIRHQRGEWDAALRAADVGNERPPSLGAARLRAAGLIVLAGRGRADVLSTAESLRPWWDEESLVLNACAQAALEVHAAAGNVDEACAVVDEAVRRLSVVWYDDWFIGRVRLSALVTSAASVAVRALPDVRRAQLVARVRGYVEDGRTSAARGRPVRLRPGVEAVAWTARLEAEWAHLRWLAGVEAPDDDELLARWRDAVGAVDYGNLFELTRARVRLAEALRATGGGDEAREVLRTARADAERMGATVLLDQMRELGAHPRAATSSAPGEPAGLDALTDREREVLALLVEARTNRQIAARLFISEKTVGVHVSNILAKLGVRSRGEAAALARG